MKRVTSLIKTALEEDNAHRDITTLSIIPEQTLVKAALVAKQDGIICGLKIFADVFRLLNKKIRVRLVARDGQKIRRGDVVARLSGPARSILSGERTALNFIQHLSGIATLTSKFVQKVKGTNARIYDTRKTIPGMRELAKYAVLCGGGYNHRFDLAEMALVKDNHLAMVRDLRGAVQAIRKSRSGIKIELECRNLSEVETALLVRAELIMFDNMDLETMKEALKIIREFSKTTRYHPLTEISGGVDLNRVRQMAATGVDRISVGALTHSAPSLDLSLEFERKGRR